MRFQFRLSKNVILLVRIICVGKTFLDDYVVDLLVVTCEMLVDLHRIFFLYLDELSVLALIRLFVT